MIALDPSSVNGNASGFRQKNSAPTPLGDARPVVASRPDKLRKVRSKIGFVERGRSTSATRRIRRCGVVAMLRPAAVYFLPCLAASKRRDTSGQFTMFQKAVT
jgi:hypothetical protein